MRSKLALLSFLVFLAASSALGESFRNPIRIPTGVDPSGILIADVNGDGRPDILWTAIAPSASSSNTVHTLIAQPDGSFAAGPVLTLPADTSPYCQIADENRDTTPDLICPAANQFTASILVFPGNGDGSFGAPIATQLPSSSQYESYWGPVIGTPADFNRDGVADLIVANVESFVSYALLGNGDGTFNLITQNANGSLSQGSNSYQAIDINGDGHVDLLFSSGVVLLGDGTGQFQPPSAGDFRGTGACTFGKLEGEAHIDMICGQGLAIDGDITGGTQLFIYRGKGDGSFSETPIKTATYGDRTNEYNGYGTFDIPIAIADLNGDGIPDILAQAGDGLSVLLGESGLGFSYPAHYATGYNTTWLSPIGQFAMRIADLNGDGLPDLIQVGPNGIYIAYSRPDGVFDTAQALELTQVIGYEVVADFNGDGIPDIAATGDQAIELSLGKGDGTFEYRKPLPRGDADFSTPLSATNAQIVHGDFNGDHRQDIIAIGSSSIYQYDDYILFGHGDGTFTSPAIVSNSSQLFPMYYQSQVFDFNRDGKDDLFNSDTNHLYVTLSNGDGSFKTVTTTIATAASLQTPGAIADVNGDGMLDAVFASQASVLIFKGQGNGAFSASPVKLPIPKFGVGAVQGSVAVAIGDFDGDGRKDIAILATPAFNAQPPANGNAAVLFVYFGNGSGGFSAGTPVTSFNRAYVNLYAADLNKDKLDDLVLKESGPFGDDYAVGIVHSLPGRKFGPEVNYYAGTGLADLAIVDLNGDGFPDLIFGNGDYNIRANSATVLMNLGNKSGVSGSLYAIAEPSDTASSFQLVASLDAPDQAALTGNVSFLVDGQPVGSAAIAGNQARLTVSKSYPAGLHTLKATWLGDTDFAAVSLVGKHQVTAGYPTSIGIFTNYNPVPFLTSFTFSVVVQSTSGTPAGSVELLDGKSRIATAHLVGGAANIPLATLVPGTHVITAQYQPATGWAAASTSLQQVVNPINPTITLAFTPQKVYAFQTIDLSAKVKAPGPVPTGTIQFQDDFSTVSTVKLVSGAAASTTSFATTGYHSVNALYSGNRDYNSNSSFLFDVNVLENPTSSRVQASPNPAVAGQSVTLSAHVASTVTTKTAPAGTVVFVDNGGQVGSAQLANGVASIKLSSLAVGTHSILVTYEGNGGFGSSIAKPLSLVIRKANPTIALSASPNPAAVSANVTLKAVVKGPRPPTGSVIFRDGSKNLTAAIPVDFEGTANFSTTALAAGKHSIVAIYSGDPNLNAFTSAPITVTINP